MKSFLIAEILGLDEEMPTIPKLIPKLEFKEIKTGADFINL